MTSARRECQKTAAEDFSCRVKFSAARLVLPPSDLVRLSSVAGIMPVVQGLELTTICYIKASRRGIFTVRAAKPTLHPHPTLGESIGMAAEAAHGSCTDVPPSKK